MEYLWSAGLNLAVFDQSFYTPDSGFFQFRHFYPQDSGILSLGILIPGIRDFYNFVIFIPGIDAKSLDSGFFIFGISRGFLSPGSGFFRGMGYPDRKPPLLIRSVSILNIKIRFANQIKIFLQLTILKNVYHSQREWQIPRFQKFQKSKLFPFWGEDR